MIDFLIPIILVGTGALGAIWTSIISWFRARRKGLDVKVTVQSGDRRLELRATHIDSEEMRQLLSKLLSDESEDVDKAPPPSDGDAETAGELDGDSASSGRELPTPE